VPAALNFEMKTLSGKPVALSKYKGKVVLFVERRQRLRSDAAIRTTQALHKKYGAEGLAVVGVPANEFGAQEPGSDEEIATFCQSELRRRFRHVVEGRRQGRRHLPALRLPHEGIEVPGCSGLELRKFLIGRDGEVVARFKTGVSPDAPEVVRRDREGIGRRSSSLVRHAPAWLCIR